MLIRIVLNYYKKNIPLHASFQSILHFIDVNANKEQSGKTKKR